MLNSKLSDHEYENEDHLPLRVLKSQITSAKHVPHLSA
jgi:hypothetical protein